MNPVRMLRSIIGEEGKINPRVVVRKAKENGIKRPLKLMRQLVRDGQLEVGEDDRGYYITRIPQSS